MKLRVQKAFEGRRTVDRVCADVRELRQTAHAQEVRQIIVARHARSRDVANLQRVDKYHSSLGVVRRCHQIDKHLL